MTNLNIELVGLLRNTNDADQTSWMHRLVCTFICGPRTFCQSATLTRFFKLIRGGERLQITLKADHHQAKRHGADNYPTWNTLCYSKLYLLFHKTDVFSLRAIKLMTRLSWVKVFRMYSEIRS